MKKIVIVVIVFSIFISCDETENQINIKNLKCEYLVNPIGIDSPGPRLSWQIKTKRPGVSQRAYQVFVGTDSSEVAGCNGNIWESGKITSDRVPIIYQGQKLNPFTRYFWGIKVQDEGGAWSNLSPVAFFETGMMGKENWKGNWITDVSDYNLKPAPYFKKDFEIQKRVKSARAYIAVAGLYELYLNGNKVGDHRLDPMFTRFDRRTLYVTYDVTKNLKQGENVLGVLLGNGWFNYQSTFRFKQAPWRARPKFCLDLRITYEDGTEELVKTGKDWKTSLSPIVFNSIYTAEHYDARLEIPGWNMPGFDDSAWNEPRLVGAPAQNIEAQVLHPIRDVEEIPAKEMIQIEGKTYLYDFGRNISGVCRITASGEAGATIRLKHAELLDGEGHVDQSNLDWMHNDQNGSDPFQTDIFILNGKGEETFMPRFNYKGFQYVEVTADNPIQLKKESLTAWFMHSDVPPVGSIRSSNPVLNKIWQATNMSYLSNLFGFPTDCPHREKCGWTNDAHIANETGLYNFDGITIYEKWLADHRYEQQANGVLPAFIPCADGEGYNWNNSNGVDITSSIAIIPWNIYLFYGDQRLLESCYYNIKRYVNHINDISVSGLTDWGLGDWTPVKSVASKEFICSTYFLIDATILAKTAKLFGKEEDYETYIALAEKIKNAINKKYLNTETGIYASGLQTELSMALKYGLVPDSLTLKVIENLAKKVIADDTHIDVGLHGTKTILNALSENGYADLAYQVALQETYPSWGWWIVNGATTLYERWPLNPGRGTLNHIMMGEISAWFYKALGGIYPDEEQPGFKNVVLKPNFVSGLAQFEAKHEGPYGTIVSSWEKSGGKVVYNVSIPPNSTATLHLNAKEVFESEKGLSENKYISIKKSEKPFWIICMESGDYQFSINQ